jgi:hypothetical protein
MNIFWFIVIIIIVIAKSHLNRTIAEKTSSIKDNSTKLVYLLLSFLFMLGQSFLEAYFMQLIIKYILNISLNYWTIYALVWTLDAFTYRAVKK